MSAKLEYKNHKWKLTVNGVEIPPSHIVYDGLVMKNDEFPYVGIMIDEIEMDDVGIEVSKKYDTSRSKTSS